MRQVEGARLTSGGFGQRKGRLERTRPWPVPAGYRACSQRVPRRIMLVSRAVAPGPAAPARIIITRNRRWASAAAACTRPSRAAAISGPAAVRSARNHTMEKLSLWAVAAMRAADRVDSGSASGTGCSRTDGQTEGHRAIGPLAYFEAHHAECATAGTRLVAEHAALPGRLPAAAPSQTSPLVVRSLLQEQLTPTASRPQLCLQRLPVAHSNIDNHHLVYPTQHSP